MENSIDCKIGNFQTEGNVIVLHKHLDKSVFVSFFHLPSMNTKIINQYRLTYTLCSVLNSLQVYVTEIKEQPIFKRIRWQLRIFESVFYKSLIRACSFDH